MKWRIQTEIKYRLLFFVKQELIPFPLIFSWQFRRPMWDVLTGRKDGRVSLLSDVNGNLPSPFSDFPTLQNLFSNKGLDINDLVALSGKTKNNITYNFRFLLI